MSAPTTNQPASTLWNQLQQSFSVQQGSATPQQSEQQQQSGLTTSQKIDIFSEVLDSIQSSSVSTASSPDSDQLQPQAQLQANPPNPQAQKIEPSVIDQALPQFIDRATDTLNPIHGATSAAKETVEGASSGASAYEVGPLQHVEVEKQPEIPVEVESYLSKVEDHAQDIVHEVVIADGTGEQADVQYPSRPVIVLPIDEEIEKKARFKGPKYSIKWLVEWSHKIIKMFAGKVIYKPQQ